MTEDDVLRVLHERVRQAGGTHAFAIARELSQPYVAQALNGTRKLGPKLLAALGIRKSITYEWINK